MRRWSVGLPLTPPKSTGYSFPQHSSKTIKTNTWYFFFESKQTKKKHDTLGTKHIQKKSYSIRIVRPVPSSSVAVLELHGETASSKISRWFRKISKEAKASSTGSCTAPPWISLPRRAEASPDSLDLILPFSEGTRSFSPGLVAVSMTRWATLLRLKHKALSSFLMSCPTTMASFNKLFT